MTNNLKRKKMVWLVCPLLFFLWAAGASAQDEMERLQNYYFETPRRPAALFAHDRHNEQAGLDDCALCHHAFDENSRKIDYESSEDQACADCHALQDGKDLPGLRQAFHLRCKGCHLTARQGPVVCAGCHSRP